MAWVFHSLHDSSFHIEGHATVCIHVLSQRPSAILLLDVRYDPKSEECSPRGRPQSSAHIRGSSSTVLDGNSLVRDLADSRLSSMHFSRTGLLAVRIASNSSAREGGASPLLWTFFGDLLLLSARAMALGLCPTSLGEEVARNKLHMHDIRVSARARMLVCTVL